ncbi:MAG: RNA methyltransferase [Bacteroidales bacterium]|nr:RNA methyltransferase [Bacteroidales bacterium]HOY38088.1 RNA methyltransferase [Bacteroidales bacterium]HQP04691.1 RNA methyltransferase [Bacteroidales bacterium]
MLSKAQIARIKSLADKKNRDIEGLFVAEGTKIIKDALESGVNIKYLIATDDWIKSNESGLAVTNLEITPVSSETMKKISSFRSPAQVLAVFEKPAKSDPPLHEAEITLALDGIQDPGNFGTIIRLCEWFGITTIICSESTVDAYNPKVIQSSMGACLRVNIYYSDLSLYIKRYKHQTKNPVYGTFLSGNPLGVSKLSQQCLIILGNEGNGISQRLEILIDTKINIPAYHSPNMQMESLNVAVAAGIICYEFRKRGLPLL